MKKMKLTAIMMIFVLLLSGCGGGGSSSSSEPTPYDGKWIAVGAEAFGVFMPAAEAFDGQEFSFEINGSNKVQLNVMGESGKGTWEEKDGKFVITIKGEEMVGVPEENKITFDNMMGMGLQVICAKEGTDAMNPENYLPEEEKALIGKWKAESVADALGDAVQIEGVSNIEDALRFEMKGDHTAELTFKGENLGSFPWSFGLGIATIDDVKDYTIIVNPPEDGKATVSVSNSDFYYDFVCVPE